MPTKVFDVECYPNFFLVVFKDVETREVRRFQISPRTELNVHGLLWILQTNRLVGFNSRNYDIPMLQTALAGKSAKELYQFSKRIIVEEAKLKDLGLPRCPWDHIDLLPVAPLKASLKLYAGRLHCRKMQDLPFNPNDEVVDQEQADKLFEYCCNDLDNTILLLEELDSQIKLREEMGKTYKQDLRSLSDAQVAERIIGFEVGKINDKKAVPPDSLVGTRFKYRIPDYVQFKHPSLVSLLARLREAEFVVGETGYVDMPDSLCDSKDVQSLKIRISNGVYTFGLGGLHSGEKSECHEADAETLLIDRDVTSYYPAIILNQGLYPPHLGPAFLEVYRSIVERRVAAKKAGDKTTAESLKIAVNGSFGKLGSKYSILYAPELIVQVCISGQLSLLMLIEDVEAAGIPVISANTDGVLMKCPTARYDELQAIIASWEARTAFTTEETRYRAVYSKDVNNYIAIKTDGKVKGKGLYTNPWETPGPNVAKLQKNPSATIIIDAVVAFLRDGVRLSKTINYCRDITKFLSVRTVNGGAMAGKDYLGKAIRWYYCKGERGNLSYKKTGNQVPKSRGSKALMELPTEFPDDVNYDYYFEEAQEVLRDIGYSTPRLF